VDVTVERVYVDEERVDTSVERVGSGGGERWI
jgi:hypothetical protein